jgi:tRNA(His) 5'-end guanylyltransferase
MTSSLLPEQIAPYEVFADCPLISGTPLVAHLIGRRFEQRLNERTDQPFDSDVQKALLKTLSHLCAVLGCSFGYADRTDLLLYAISQGSDARRLLSRLAGEASAKLSLLVGEVFTFDVRLFEIPSVELARTYFLWRRQRAEASALERYVTYTLEKAGTDARSIPSILSNTTSEQRLSILRQNSVDYSQQPSWQRHGSSVYMAQEEGRAPHLVIDLRLPDAAHYPEYLVRHLV